MKSVISTRIFEGLILCVVIALPCYPRNANSDHPRHPGKQLIVELAIEGWSGFSRFEVPLAEGAGRGGGGGISPPAKVSRYSVGLSVLELRKREALLSLTMTLQLADGTEKKIDERFLVIQGKKREYRFAYGVKITSYFTARRKIRKVNRSPLIAAPKLIEEKSVSEQTILWRRIDRPGHESARLSFNHPYWHLSGTAVFAHERQPCRLDYLLACDSEWQTLSGKVAGWVGEEVVEIELSV
jgi:hypothetical protein